MTDMAAKSNTALVLDLAFNALRVRDPRLNDLAAEVLGRLNTGTVRRLILEAASKKNSPAHRLRVLAVIERVGQLSGPKDWLDLSILAADRNPKIRHAAARCLAKHSPAPAELGACG